ncbi:MAG TPA: hypothetical protein VFK46_08290 [Candidatus Macondimonas sp.]|jgi:hypothetical protein|nr:hypothetical protein [Candidatus Macondimonas sp.]
MRAELAAPGFIACSWLFSLDAVCLPTSVGSPLYGQPDHMDGFYWDILAFGEPRTFIAFQFWQALRDFSPRDSPKAFKKT